MNDTVKCNNCGIELKRKKQTKDGWLIEEDSKIIYRQRINTMIGNEEKSAKATIEQGDNDSIGREQWWLTITTGYDNEEKLLRKEVFGTAEEAMDWVKNEYLAMVDTIRACIIRDMFEHMTTEKEIEYTHYYIHNNYLSRKECREKNGN